MRMGWALTAVLAVMAGTAGLQAESCTTQSKMTAADRDGLAGAARDLAMRVQSNDTAGLESASIAELGRDFASMRAVAAETSGHLRGDTLTVSQIYLLDATQMKSGAGEPALFSCALNGTQASVDFTIPGLTPGVYGFAIVDARGQTPWRVPMLLRKDNGRWLLAGFYPRAIEAAGHDGLWYWREARRQAEAKELWNAWLFYGEAAVLLQPANFVQTTHLEKLEDEQRTATPPPLSGGISADVPLVVRGTGGNEFRMTGLTSQSSLDRPQLDVAITLDAGAATDAAAWRTRSDEAARALVGAYPELRKQFGGVFVSLESGGRGVFAIERPMAELR